MPTHHYMSTTRISISFSSAALESNRKKPSSSNSVIRAVSPQRDVYWGKGAIDNARHFNFSRFADWKRHKLLCLSCRLYKEGTDQIPAPLKIGIDEYSMIQLPPIDIEYSRKFCSKEALAHKIWIQGGLQTTRDMMDNNLHNMNGTGGDLQDLVKRWQEVSPNLESFLVTAQPGDIFLRKQYNVYDPGAPQQFRNTPMAVPGKLKNGKTLVDIGFVDFGMALNSIDSLSFDGDPLVVVGYEVEPQCVAKSLIMLQMMLEGTTKTRSIVEVWLSSLWSKKTFQAFKKATRTLLEHDTTMRPEVQKIIEFWNGVPKTRKKEALALQTMAMLKVKCATFAMQCCSLESEHDRVAFLRYFLTKALYEDDTTTLGSVVMGHTNEDIGVKQSYQNCMEAVPTYVHREFDSHFRPGLSFMGRTIKYFEEKLATYSRHVHNGSLLFTPKLGIVSLKNRPLVEEIRSMDAYTVHWSNVVDYLKPADFHAIAKRISGPDTIHVLHSCNWSSLVYGTDIHDVNHTVRLGLYAQGLFCRKMIHSMIHGLQEHVPMHYRNICSTVLGRRYVSKFFQYLFKDEEVNCACYNGNTPLQQDHPFACNPITAFVAFAYRESGITFGIDAYEFDKEED